LIFSRSDATAQRKLIGSVVPLRRRERNFYRMSKLYVINELWQFMRENKKFWLAPIIITLVAVGVLLVLAKGSAIAPFIYTLF
jgi:hypothetical protein